MGKKKPNGRSKAGYGVKQLLQIPLPNPQVSEDSFAQMTTTQSQLSEVKKHLNAMIDAMHDRPSLLTRASIFWGELPTWLKIVSGIVFFGSIITIGVFAHIIAMVVVGSITAVGFIASSLLLDDHYDTTLRSIDHLKEGVFGLANVLELTINALDNIRLQLTIEIEYFTQENKRFAELNCNLHREIDVLSGHLEQLSMTNEALADTQRKLAEVTKAYENINTLFATNVAELADVKNSMGLEIEKQSKISVVLHGAVDALVKTVIVDENNRGEFQAKLDKFLSDSTTSFDQIAERICQAEKDLVVVKADLERSNRRYEKLLDRQGVQVDKLEKMTAAAIHQPQEPEKLRRDRLKNLMMFPPQSAAALHGVGPGLPQSDEAVDDSFFLGGFS